MSDALIILIGFLLALTPFVLRAILGMREMERDLNSNPDIQR